jgi:hypothetical protein
MKQYIFLIGGITGMSSNLLGWFFKGGQRRKFNKLIQVVNKTIDDTDLGEDPKHNQFGKSQKRYI